MKGDLKVPNQEDEKKTGWDVPEEMEQEATPEAEMPVDSTEPAADPAEVQTEPQPKEEPKEPDELTRLKEENAALTDRLLRTMAEYDNFRKRSQKEKDAIYPGAVADTVAKLLPVCDNIERALACETQDLEFRKGVEMIYSSFQEIMGKLEVVSFGEAGEEFDPALHNAVMHLEDDTVADNTITQVFQKGYKIGDRVLRFAMVQVAN